jgi:hypothetical protein
MTIYSTAKWAARQAQSGISRATIREVDDNHLCQECKYADVTHSETPSNFEIWQPLGITSVSMKQKDAQQGQQGQQGGQGGGDGGGGQGGGGDQHFNKNQPKGEASEMVMVYANGHRAHPIGMPQDRRCRPYDMDPGEGGLYDSQDGKQMTYFRNRGDSTDGVYIVGCDADPPDQGSGGGAGGQAGGQQSTARSVYMRHANKKKQSRKPQKHQQQQGGGTPTRYADGSQRYKHEGDSINTEVQLTSGKINFNDGGGNKGFYDNGKKDWLYHDGSGATHSMRADKTHSHIKNDGGHVWVQGAPFKSMPFVIKPDPCT